jgi:hypothetical protein
MKSINNNDDDGKSKRKEKKPSRPELQALEHLDEFLFHMADIGATKATGTATPSPYLPLPTVPEGTYYVQITGRSDDLKHTFYYLEPMLDVTELDVRVQRDAMIEKLLARLNEINSEFELRGYVLTIAQF